MPDVCYSLTDEGSKTVQYSIRKSTSWATVGQWLPALLAVAWLLGRSHAESLLLLACCLSRRRRSGLKSQTRHARCEIYQRKSDKTGINEGLTKNSRGTPTWLRAKLVRARSWSVRLPTTQHKVSVVTVVVACPPISLAFVRFRSLAALLLDDDGRAAPAASNRPNY